MKKSAEKLSKPTVTIDDTALKEAGFIQSGYCKFKELVKAFSDELFLKSVKYSDAGSRDNDREVSADNVYTAVKTIYVAPLHQHKKRNAILQGIEYVSSALVGVGASNLNEIWGLLMLLFCFVVGVGCFTYRTISNNEQIF